MSYEELIKQFGDLTLESEDHWDYRGKDNSEKDYVHGLCTYPAMMVPKMQREMMDVYLSETTKKNIKVLDPFAGAGTILVESMLRGLNVVGIDINPLAVLLCKAKTTILLPNILEKKTEELLARINADKKRNDFEFDGINKWFTEKAIKGLSAIREEILREDQVEYRRFYWAAFCEVVRTVSNSRDCTYKLHIKERKEIDSYNKDAIKLFFSVLKGNIDHYLIFYKELMERGLIKKDGITYKQTVKVILGDSIEYLKRSKEKYDLVFTSPPYGDNHTTVSYGQYSILPLRWMEWKDIDENIDPKLFDTQCAIDNVSMGGRKKYDAERLIILCDKSKTFNQQIREIQNIAPKQVAKVVAFYDDLDRFLAVLAKKIKPNSILVWTVGNRQIAKKEIYMDKILTELGSHYNLSYLTGFTRKITKKRMPEMNAHSGKDKGVQGTMTREHILIFAGGAIDGGETINFV